MYDYTDRENRNSMNKVLSRISYFFISFYILECILKIVAKGFIVDKDSYLRNGWNILDFFVVISSILELLPLNVASIKGIRALRALRPLRSINAIPSMKKLVKVLLISLPNLSNVVLLLTFIVILFAIFGLTEFNGQSYSRCRLTPEPLNDTYWPILEDYNWLCNPDSPTSCPKGSYCGNPQEYGIDLKYENLTKTRFISYGIV